MDWQMAVRAGVYPVAFAAKLTETTNARVASWFRTRDGSRLAPAILTPFEPVAGQLIMPFLALVETRFVGRFRKHGLSLQTIRKVARKLREKYGLEHPFATERRFRTDGKRIMMEAIETVRERLDSDESASGISERRCRSSVCAWPARRRTRVYPHGYACCGISCRRRC